MQVWAEFAISQRRKKEGEDELYTEEKQLQGKFHENRGDSAEEQEN